MENLRNLSISQVDIQAFCAKWKIDELDVFGSVLRDDFTPQSDVDFLYTFSPESEISLFKFMDMQDELAQIVGRPVDLVSRKSIERSENWLRKKEILSTAKPFYVAT